MGKSTLLPLFKKCGADAIDADKVVSSLLDERDVLDKIGKLLGEGVFSGNGFLDKKKVADIIFRDSDKRLSLEDILHPLVFEKVNDLLRGMADKDRVVIIEVPLLFERGYKARFDKIITVQTDEETALSRVAGKGISRKEALLRLKSQLPIKEKMELSDFVINNNGTIAETRAQVETIYNKLLEEAKRIGNNTGTRKL